MATTRFMRRGVTKFFFVPTVANKAAPTATEVNAGIDISKQVSDVTGFSFANTPIGTPNFQDRFTPQVPGEDTAPNSDFHLYELKGGADPIKTGLPKDTNGFVVIFPGGTAGAAPAIADVADVWPVTIASNTRVYTAGNEAAKYQVSFSITDIPAFDAALT